MHRGHSPLNSSKLEPRFDVWRNVSRPGHLYPSLFANWSILATPLRHRSSRVFRKTRYTRYFVSRREDLRKKKREEQGFRKSWNSIDFQSETILFFFFFVILCTDFVKLNKLEQQVIRLKSRDMSVNEPRLARCTVHANFLHPLSPCCCGCKTAPVKINFTVS